MQIWKELGKYHYLNQNFRRQADVYCSFINNNLVGMISVLNFPHPKAKNLKQGHRTVIKPDYQGIGLGNILIDWVANYIVDTGFRYIATTSAPSIINYRKKHPNWICTRKGRVQPYSKTGQFSSSNASSTNRLTTSWEFVKK